MKILLQNLQCGANLSGGYWHLALGSWKYFMPHSQEPIKKLSQYMKDEQIEAGLFTEADAGSFRTRNIDEIKIISEISGLQYNKFFLTASAGKIINQGNAIVSRYPIIDSKSYLLPGGSEKRYLCHSIIKVKNKKINLFVTHLTLGFKDRQEQLKTINSIIKSVKGTRIFGGDLNIINEDELRHIDSLRRISFLKTYPSWDPKKFLDNIFISDDIKRYELSTTKIKMSDHLGLILEVK